MMNRHSERGGGFCLLMIYTRGMVETRARWVIGIDEAGRGPLAGPVAVGAVCIDTADTRLMEGIVKTFPKVKDSKQLSEPKRDVWMRSIKELGIPFAVMLISEKHIDHYGISHAIARGIEKALQK